MADFVNYNKRGVSLPYGCKDLADVLRECRQKRAPFAGDEERFKKAVAELDLAKPEVETATGQLADLEFHFSRVFRTSALEASLSICASGEICLGVEWHRSLEMDICASVSAEEGSELECKTRDFFAALDLETPKKITEAERRSTFFPGIPLTLIFQFKPAPTDPKSLTELASAYLREVRGFDESTELEFWFAETRAAGGVK